MYDQKILKGNYKYFSTAKMGGELARYVTELPICV